ncbi:hypothetical protein LCGC14_0666750 [marine sediment metagenome]|uniref:DksA C4-type domain-containing protein n=1 Tax=marine sediment metagenome TaxID=412755 RepID=A0A0F9TDK5_9ZZZZ
MRTIQELERVVHAEQRAIAKAEPTRRSTCCCGCGKTFEELRQEASC